MKKERIVAFAIIVFIILFLLSNLKATNFQLQPNATDGKDTYIRENTPTNFGAINIIRVGKVGSGVDHKGLIFFNISNITYGYTIISAKMQLYVSNSYGNSNISVKVYRVTSNWEALETNWTSNTSSQLWTTAGGDYEEMIDAQIISNSSAGQFVNFTITTAVREWINQTYENFGLILISQNASGNYTEFSSSDSATESQRPQIFIDYTTNAVPTIDIITTGTSPTTPKNIGQNITFNISWTDYESNSAKAFVCNSSNINFSGCQDRTYCSVPLQPLSPSSCTYKINETDNRTNLFYFAVCDSGSTNCSLTNSSYFYMNHAPNISITQPNGGEKINQSQGNYRISFNVSDSDADLLKAGIYYGISQNSTANPVVLNLNLTSYCYDADSSTRTTNNCSYSWNTSGIYGVYYLTIILNDTFSLSNASSSSSFNITSIIDNVPPNLTAQWIDSNIISGKLINIYANASDAYLNTVWVSINSSTSQVNLTMTNTSALTYNVSWIATEVGNYQFKVYANDTLNNINDTTIWQSFSISKPNASSQNETAPSIALPLSLIRITSRFNATDALKGIYAYLNVPDGFVFISNYSQNNSLGNFTATESKTAIWIVSVPLSEAYYTLNITYHDKYGNFWNSSNFRINVTSAVGGGGGGSSNTSVYFVTLSGYPEVQASDNYYAESYFTLNGQYSTPDSMKISLYDPSGNMIVSPVDMTQKQTGIYNYTYSVPSSQTTGQWEAKVNATKNSINYYANTFWKLVGALFDVGSIVVHNSSIDHLNISVIVHNNASSGSSDLTLNWNLTRTDTNAQLKSGAETFAVAGGNSITKYYSPSTSYIGEVKITFLGKYSGTETAGAYKIFNTTYTGAPFCGDRTCSNGESCITCSADCGSCPAAPSEVVGGGGGGGIAKVKLVEKKANFTILFEKETYLTKNIEKTILLIIKNTGEKELTNISLELEKMTKEFYTVSPLTIKSLKAGESKNIEIKFLITDFIGEYSFNYLVKTKELEKRELGKIIVLNMKDYFLKEIERLNKRVENVKNRTSEENVLNLLKTCESIIEKIKSNIEKEEYVTAEKDIKTADNCIDNVEKNIKEAVPFIKIDSWGWIITWLFLIILIAVLIFIIYILYKKLLVINFFKKEDVSKKPASMRRESIEKQIKSIEDKMGL